MLLVRSVDGQSNKCPLIAPTPSQLARLVRKSRTVLSANPIITVEKPIARSLKRRLTDCQRQKIIARREAGETLQALANEYRLSETGLSEMLLTAKVQIKKTPITEVDSDRVVALYESGLSVRQIVVELGYSVGTIRRVLKERDVKMRVRGRS